MHQAERRRRERVWLLACLPLLAFLVHALLVRYVVDDAFITYRYARNLVEGQGLVYNPGERVEGYTNFSWVLLSAGLTALGAEPVAATRAAGLAAGVATLLLCLAWGRRRHPGPSQLPLIAPSLLALNAAFALWAQAGLETALFTLLVTAGVLGLTSEWRFPWWALWFALAALTRPEGVLFFGLAWGAAAASAAAAGRGGTGRGPAWTRLLWGAALFLAVLVPYTLWRHAYFGDWLPNTWYAKTGGGLAQAGRGLSYLGRGLWAFGGMPFLPAVLLAWRGRSRQHLVPAVVVAGWLLYVVLVGGDGLAMYRFLVPALPLAALLAQDALAALGAAVSVDLPGARRTALRVAALLVVGFLSLRPALVGPARAFVDEDRGRVSQHWTNIGKWLADYARPGESVAVTTAGAIPYYSRLRAIDMLGITDRHIARSRVAGMGRGIAGHEKHDVDYVLDRRPTYLLHYEFLINHPTVDRRQFDTPWNPGLAELADNPRFRQLYRPEVVALAPDVYFAFFVLRTEFGGPPPRGLARPSSAPARP